jgi:hypothetical protein
MDTILQWRRTIYIRLYVFLIHESRQNGYREITKMLTRLSLVLRPSWKTLITLNSNYLIGLLIIKRRSNWVWKWTSCRSTVQLLRIKMILNDISILHKLILYLMRRSVKLSGCLISGQLISRNILLYLQLHVIIFQFRGQKWILKDSLISLGIS